MWFFMGGGVHHSNTEHACRFGRIDSDFINLRACAAPQQNGTLGNEPYFHLRYKTCWISVCTPYTTHGLISRLLHIYNIMEWILVGRWMETTRHRTQSLKAFTFQYRHVRRHMGQTISWELHRKTKKVCHLHIFLSSITCTATLQSLHCI